ncbi:AgmX/PglI C-terminal domain-containing protein [uncultured Gilvimarinus sp.]|mgnify:CR=1 FL=1|uniref:AgmX/PglI C-terminal domain-containing protein n=1 Tax=uncultured Gilvimarinus sp. TaxID=1689143 RepID=UPI0030DA1B1A
MALRDSDTSENYRLLGQNQADDNRFIKWVAAALVVFALIGIIVPLISLPEIEREEKAKLPPQLARVLLEKEELKQPEPEPEPQPEPEPEPEPKEEPEPEEVEPEPEPETAPEPDPEPVTQVEKAREKAKGSGVLQFQDTLADMREAIDTKAVASDEITRGQAEAERTERSLITSGAEADSGGINTSALSQDTGGVALSGRETTQVESALGGADATASKAQDTRQAGERSDEEIRRVMSQHASALDRYYRRALRANPALQGKVVLKLVINPDGSLASVSILSSDLRDAELESKVIARVKLITFEPRDDVVVTTRNYTLNFLPQL